jgi:Tat protein translocase TatB subunit
MFGIGLFEIILIFVVALIVLGPHRLPETARTVGKWFYHLRETVDSVQSEITKEWESEKNIPTKGEQEKDDIR